MKPRRFTPEQSGSIKRDQPIRLEAAATLAFPDGSMTATGLRREIDRGRLKAWKMAGRVYTTLDEVAAMRERCAIQPRVKPAKPETIHHLRPSERMGAAAAAQARLEAALKRH